MTVRIHIRIATTFAATLALSAAGLCLAQTASSSGSAQNPGLRMISYNLPSQPLADALKAVGAQDNINVLMSPELVDGKTAPALKAELTFNDAVVELLKGTGLTYKYLSDKTIVLAAEGSKTSAVSPDVRPSSLSDGEGGSVRLAQVDETGAGSATAQSPQSSPNLAGESAKLEEIVVTAQKREERLQDVPISITALTGKQMDRSRAESLNDVLNQIPGVAMFEGLQSGQSQIVVRGVTSVNSVYGGASTTAYYLDNVPFGLIDAPTVPETNPYDLERVEVLRGPQGTLYGASSLNGVVRILTKDPDLDRFEFKARALMSMTKDSDDENYRGDMAVNVPLVDGKLAVRAVVGAQNMGGWIDAPNRDDVNKVEGQNYRVKLKAQPTDDLSIVLSAWHNSYEDDAPPLSRADRTTTDTHYGTTPDPSTCAPTVPASYCARRRYGTSTEYDVYGATIDYDFSKFSLSSRTGYLDYTLDSGVDAFNLFLADQYFQEEVFSEELVATSKLDSPLRWSLGAFYRDADEDTRQLWFGTDGTRTSKSVAVFGEVGHSFLNEKLDFTAGLRYFRDKASLNAREAALPAPLNTSSTFDSLTPRVVLTLHPTDESIVYASYSEGFRSGIEQRGGCRRGGTRIGRSSGAGQAQELRSGRQGKSF